jgi:hypothetical protein
MNNRSLAIEISKHPLIKRLLEGKLATTSEVARLVVEELLKENPRTDLIKQVASAQTEKDLGNLIQSAHTVFGEDSMDYFNTQVEIRRKEIKERPQNNNEQEEAKEKTSGATNDFADFKDQIDTTLNRPDLDKQEKIKLINKWLKLANSILKVEEKKELKEYANDEITKISPESTEDKEETYQLGPPGKPDQEVYKSYTAEEKAVIKKLLDFMVENKLLEENQQHLDRERGFLMMDKDKLEEFKKSLDDTEREVLKTLYNKIENNPALIAGVKWYLQTHRLQKSDSKEQSSEEQPTKIDTTEIDPEVYNSLKTAVGKYRTEFYSQRWLVKQGEIVKNLITQLKSLTSPEMVAAFSKSKEGEMVSEGDEPEVKLDSRDIRNLKTDYTSFLEVLKLAKGRLEKFTEAAQSGRAVSSVYKKDFLKIIQQVQNNVAELTIEVNKILQQGTLTEAEEPEEELKPFQEIDKAYDKVTGLLSPIESSEEANAVANLPNISKEALKILQSISHHFPSVNPFKSTSVDFPELKTEFDAAITELKPFLYKVTDLLRKSTGGETTLRNSIEAFTIFSGEVQRIFGVKSDIEEIKPTAQLNAPAVKGEDKEGNEINQSTTWLDSFFGSNNKEEEEKGSISKGLEKIKQFFSSFAKKNNYSNKDFMSSQFTNKGKLLFSKRELEVINKFIDLLLDSKSIKEAMGAEYEKAFQQKLGISLKKIRSVFASLSPEEQQTLTQALLQRKDGANLRTKKELLARMIRVKKKAKELVMQDEKQAADLLVGLNDEITEDELATKLKVEKEDLSAVISQVNSDLGKRETSSKEPMNSTPEATEKKEDEEEETPKELLTDFLKFLKTFPANKKYMRDMSEASDPRKLTTHQPVETEFLKKLRGWFSKQYDEWASNATAPRTAWWRRWHDFKNYPVELLYITDAFNAWAEPNEKGERLIKAYRKSKWLGKTKLPGKEIQEVLTKLFGEKASIKELEQEAQTTQEQIANKLKPLIWETIRKNK